METANQIPPEVIKQAEQFKTFIGFDPKNQALMEDSLAFVMNHQLWSYAEAFIEIALQNNFNTPSVLSHQGFLFIVRGDFTKAEEVLSQALDAGAQHDTVKFNLAYATFMNYDIESALKIIHDNNIEHLDNAKLLKARCLHQLGELDAAKSLLNAIDDGSIKQEALSVLALVLCDNSEHDLAYEISCKAIAHYPSMEALLAKASVEMERQDYTSSESTFSTLCESYPSVGRAWSGLSLIQFRNFELEKALSSVQKAVEFMPEHIGTWHVMAWIYILQDNVEQALSAFEASYKLDRSFAETHGGLASVYAIKGDINQAEKHIELAKRLDPSSQSLIFAKLVLLNKAGKHADAEALFDNAINAENPFLGSAPVKIIKERLEYLTNQANKEKLH